MLKPKIPNSETERLAALHSLNLLDTPEDERFDRITRMAKRLFGVEIALVSLIDRDRQWFKSRQGLTISETPRDISFCGHAILDDKVMVVPDAQQDTRFADNPLVTDQPNIRFYAGCPLQTYDGHRIGTLCIIDSKPRQLDSDDHDSLRDLASMVESELTAIQLVTQDELTGLINRRGFLMLGRQALRLCMRQTLPATLLFFDLNEFKPINDQFGHAEGDWALRAFADQLRNCCRRSDIIARLGGDEFVALLINSAASDAEVMINRFASKLKQYNESAQRGYHIRYACGAVEFDPLQHDTIDALLAVADQLMYQQKRQR